MKKKTIKIITLIVLIIPMLFYIGWVFYISEPQYINNSNKQLEKYDYVSIRKYSYDDSERPEVICGTVLQLDNKKALVKCKGYYDSLYELDLQEKEYRVIGRGTLYHKVNYHTGFNIMMISQFFMVILCGYLFYTLLILINSLI